MPITRATFSDLPAVLALMRQMQQDDRWSEAFDEAIVRNTLSELLPNARFGVVHLVWEEARPVAYLVICFDYSLEYRGKGAWIDELFVERTHRGKGIGTQLLELAEMTAAEQGAKFLHLEVSHGNRAVALYRRQGFVNHERYLMTKRIGE